MRSPPEPAAAAVWGLLADIHGNLAALERALALLQAAGATRLGLLGDYLGRGESDACVRLIRSLADLAVVGNRDLDWQDRVAPESKAWVCSLPRQARAGPLLLAHGDARLTPALSTAQIRHGFVRTWPAMLTAQATVLAFGHSHHARLWRTASPEAPPELIAAPEAAIEPGYRYVLNVGTTGLPFPGKGGPSVALVDFLHGRIRHLPLDRG